MNDGPAVGTVLADAPLLDIKGKNTSLSRLAGDRVLVLLVYEGAASPTAVRHLLDFRDATMAFEKLGARIAAVSADEPSAAAFLKTERGLGFTLACDPEKKALREWGLLDPAETAFSIPARVAVSIAFGAVFAWLEVARKGSLAALAADDDGLIDETPPEPLPPPPDERIVEALPVVEEPIIEALPVPEEEVVEALPADEKKDPENGH